MVGPVIRTPLLDRMSIQHQFTLGNTDRVKFNLTFVIFFRQYLCDECKDKKNQQFDLKGWSTEIVEVSL
jgi:hypothetical protein